MKILHVITGLGVGGAEGTLLKLATAGMVGVEHAVISLTAADQMRPQFEEANVRVLSAGMRSFSDAPATMWWLRRMFRREDPTLIQTWLYHADLLAGAAAWGMEVPVVWNLRHGGLKLHRNKRTTWLTIQACARLSRALPARIICCSNAVAEEHSQIGYDASRLIVIPNGYDTTAFRPDAASRLDVRRELGLDPGALLTGWVGRFHPQKDPRNLIEAAGRVLPKFSDCHLVLVGRALTPDNAELQQWIQAHNIGNQVHLLGPRRDIARLGAALDLFVSSSAGEGMPNAVGEAMSCGVPCIVTAVGGSADLVGDTGSVVPPLDPGALAKEWAEFLEAGADVREDSGRRARCRIEEKFGLARVVEAYARTWRQVAAGR